MCNPSLKKLPDPARKIFWFQYHKEQGIKNMNYKVLKWFTLFEICLYFKHKTVTDHNLCDLNFVGHIFKLSKT